jgi:signal transduction histidine kinase
MTDSAHLAELVTATQALAAATDFSGTLRATLQAAARLARADSAVLVLFNRTTQQWFVHSTLGDRPVDQGQAALAAAASGAAAVTESTAALPLAVKGRVVGALGVEQAGLTPEGRRSLEAFAASAALAIDSTLARTDFVSTVTHELRLPMTSIKGYSDLIRGGMAGSVSDMQKQLLETVRVNVDWMNALLSDLSDIAKVETGRLKVDLEAVNPADCIEEASVALQPQFVAKAQTLSVSAAGLPRVYADRKRLAQMLTYLLTNANRYTPADGQVQLRAEAQGSTVRFAVTDNGVGVAPADQARLFTQFFRSEDQAVRDHKGWGLALHLVKQLAGLFGGEVGAESAGVPGRGSTFWFTIPIEESKS